MPRFQERGIPQLHARRQNNAGRDGVAAALQEAREVELQWHSCGCLLWSMAFQQPKLGGHGSRRRARGVLAAAWLVDGCLGSAAPRRFASVGVRRRSEPPAARVWRLLAPPGARDGPQKGCPQRPSLLALGSASFRRRVRTDGCVGPLRSRPKDVVRFRKLA